MSFVASVIVSTYNRAGRLPRLVDALTAQQLDGPFEVILVDDCSTDDTWAVARELAADSAVPVKVLQTARNSGPATGRNIGWRAASAPIVVFTDDDCTPQSGWLAALVTGLAHADVVQGTTRPVPDGALGPFVRTMWIDEWSDLFETCNMAYRRDVLERTNGFDESFPRAFGEDADLGWRALETGARTAYVPDALVYHDVEHDTHLRDFVAEVRGHARKVWTVRVLERHPGLRRRFHRRWFYAPDHPRVLAGLAASVLATSRRGLVSRIALLAAGWAPYFHYRLAVRRRLSTNRSAVPVIALGLVSDVAEVSAVAVGSLRFRTLLL